MIVTENLPLRSMIKDTESKGILPELKTNVPSPSSLPVPVFVCP